MKGDLNTVSGLNPRGLRFDTQKDALDFARKSTESGRRWVRERGFSCTQDYLKYRSYLQVSLRASVNTGKFDFIAEVVPDARSDCQMTADIASAYRSPEKFPTATSERNSKNALVFVRARQTSQCVEHIVPSVVRIKSTDKGDKLWVDVFAPIRNFVLEFIGGFSEGKIHPPRVGTPQKDAGIANRLIECVAEVVDNLRRWHAHRGRDAVMESEFEDLVAGLRISLLDNVVSAIVDKGIASRFEVIDACFCPIEE